MMRLYRAALRSGPDFATRSCYMVIAAESRDIPWKKLRTLVGRNTARKKRRWKQIADKILVDISDFVTYKDRTR
jgi:hypothetical protein